MAINKVIIVGNVGKDPEVKRGEKPVANFVVATSEKWTDRNGERQEKTEWHNVVTFGKTAEFVEKYVSKGDNVYVEGKLRTDSYEKDGEKKYIVKVYADTIQKLGQKKEGDKPSPKNAPAPQPAQEEYFESNPDDLPW